MVLYFPLLYGLYSTVLDCTAVELIIKSIRYCTVQYCVLWYVCDGTKISDHGH